MSAWFEELAWAPTPIAEISLRRRTEPVTGTDIYEVKLGDEYLMSSLFTAAEVEMARLALGRLQGSSLEIVVGGLGLGYTAQAVLTDDRVDQLLVIDALEPVIEWHHRGLVPLGPVLTSDHRCRLVRGDFFAMSAGEGFDPESPDRLFDAVILDIDHSPQHLLADTNAAFYGMDGTRELAGHLRKGGVYALWSNDPPDDTYLTTLSEVFVDVAAEIVRFPNPLQDSTATNTVYLAVKPD